jgi:hypothetical protein
MARPLLTVESRSACSLPSGVDSGLPAEAQAGGLSLSSSSGWRRTRGVRLTALSSRPHVGRHVLRDEVERRGEAPRGAKHQGGRSPNGGRSAKGAKATDVGVLVDEGGVPPSAVGDYGDGFGGAVGREVAGRFRQHRDLSVDGGWCEGWLVDVASTGTPRWSVDDGVRGVWSIVPEQGPLRMR